MTIPHQRRRAETLFIGDELLAGLRTNTHLRFLGGILAEQNLEHVRATELPDERAAIAEAFRTAWERADLVVTTGGLGPTEDDLTVEALAHALDCPLEHSAEAEAHLRAFFRARGRTPTENNLRQCLLLRGAELLENPNGTAVGQWLERDGKILVVLPGPPRELHPMVHEQVVPRLQARGWAHEGQRHIILRTSGVGESQLAEQLEGQLAPLRERFDIAFAASPGVVDLRLTALDAAVDEAALRAAAETLRKALGDDFACFGEQPLAEVVLQQLRVLGRTLAVAESCTGGLLASTLTDIPGASKVFKGGVVCYLNEAKESLLDIPPCLLEQHGAVSAESAVAMATGVAERLESDYAVSITGFAGPSGGNEPAGTVYVGYHSPAGVWSGRFMQPGSRTAVKQRAVNTALDFLRRKLRQLEMEALVQSLRS